MDRYYSESPILADRVVLAGPEAHHLIHVMRASPGLEVVVFDGSGAEFSARVERLGRTEVELAILQRTETDRELPGDLTVAVALPKGDRQKWLVEKATELGVTRLVPLETARGVAQPVEQALARLRRGVIEASKQCGRNRLMEIAPPERWEALVGSSVSYDLRLVAHPQDNTGQAADPIGGLRDRSPAKVIVGVGPEGGFTASEVQLARAAGWQMMDLGPRILRIETAAITVAAILAQALMGLGSDRS